MDGRERPAQAAPPPSPSKAVEGFRGLRRASLVGLLGQVLIWGSVLALYIVGSLYSTIPVSTTIAYGANGLTVSSGEIFGLNFTLLLGAAVALLSCLLWSRSLEALAKGSPPLHVDSAVALATVGTIGFGLFAVGWAAWLGSFVAPGASNSGYSAVYSPVLASNLADVVNLLLILGGLLAFGGVLGIVVGASTVGATYDESGVELGGALSLLPVFSVIGLLLLALGLKRGERKLEGGWIPPPPPPAVAYPPPYAPAGPSGGPPGAWDSLAIVLVVVLVLLWVFILPFTFYLGFAGTTKGPIAPGGNGSAPPAVASSGGTLVAPILLAGLVVTAVLLPLAVVRNRRRRQRPAAAPPRPPPPPPPAPVEARNEDDPLDHLV